MDNILYKAEIFTTSNIKYVQIFDKEIRLGKIPLQ